MADDTLKIKVFHMQQVTMGKKLKLSPGSLQLKEDFETDCPDLESLTVKLLAPGQTHIVTNTIMDVIPISTKVLGRLGAGITHTLAGVTVVMTGAICAGEQMHEFGSSEGILVENMMFDRVGTPKSSDHIILIDCLAKAGTAFNRALALKMFEIVDQYIQEIREELKLLSGNQAIESYEYKEEQHPGKPKVSLVKQVAGQGAMYDMLLFPDEPSGFKGGQSIIDMNNMPVFLSANEYRDGALRSMV